MDAIVALNGIFSPCELIFNVNAVFELIKSRSMAVSETVQAGLCQTWLETPKTGFLASRLI